MLIAIPSDSTDGLDAAISQHFGHCAAFTLIDITDGAIGSVSVLENSAHESGGCMAPVNQLKENGVDVLIAGGMGMRPLSGFQQVGINVHFKEDSESVKEAVELFLEGGCRSFSEAQTCGGGEGSCGGHDHDHHHHHAEPQIIPIDGPVEVRVGRLITLEYVLKDTDGNLLETSDENGPMRFIFGAHQILPAIEQAVEGLGLEARVVRTIAMADAFGDRDEEQIFEVPRSKLPADAVIGAIVAGHDRSGRPFPLTILHLDDEIARLDSNHPFAGKDLVFDLTVKNIEGVKST